MASQATVYCRAIAHADSRMVIELHEVRKQESPISSTHEAEAAATPAVVPSAPVSVKDLLEDVESLELGDGDSDSEEAFLTDEEYELIASDDEMETAKNGRK